MCIIWPLSACHTVSQLDKELVKPICINGVLSDQQTEIWINSTNAMQQIVCYFRLHWLNRFKFRFNLIWCNKYFETSCVVQRLLAIDYVSINLQFVVKSRIRRSVFQTMTANIPFTSQYQNNLHHYTCGTTFFEVFKEGPSSGCFQSFTSW